MADEVGAALPAGAQQQQQLSPEEEQQVIQAFGMFLVGYELSLQNELKSSIND